MEKSCVVNIIVFCIKFGENLKGFVYLQRSKKIDIHTHKHTINTNYIVETPVVAKIKYLTSVRKVSSHFKQYYIGLRDLDVTRKPIRVSFCAHV